MKKAMPFLLVVFILVLSCSAPAHGMFRKGRSFLTGQLMVLEHTTFLGINLEYGLSKKIGLGGDIMLYMEGNGGLYLSPDLSYHLDVKNRKLDIRIGGGPALVVDFENHSDFRFKLFGEVRYFFDSRLGGGFKLLFDMGDGGGIGGAVGLVFRL